MDSTEATQLAKAKFGPNGFAHELTDVDSKKIVGYLVGSQTPGLYICDTVGRGPTFEAAFADAHRNRSSHGNPARNQG